MPRRTRKPLVRPRSKVRPVNFALARQRAVSVEKPFEYCNRHSAQTLQEKAYNRIACSIFRHHGLARYQGAWPRALRGRRANSIVVAHPDRRHTPLWVAHRMAKRRVLTTKVGSGFDFTVTERPLWCWVLKNIAPRPHPAAWALCFPMGGALVVPDALFPPQWITIMLGASPGHWLWAFWERWDVLLTLPGLPADLVNHGLSRTLPQSAVLGRHIPTARRASTPIRDSGPPTSEQLAMLSELDRISPAP